MCFYYFFFQNPSDLLRSGNLVDPVLSSKQAQKLLRLICMQQKNCSEVDVADDPASHRRILTNILENLDEWNLRIATIDVKLINHQLQANQRYEIIHFVLIFE